MKIIIVGIGKLGSYLAKSLVKDGNEVTLVDVDFSLNEEIINNIDLKYIVGSGLDSKVLEEAGIEYCDLLISVMEQDEQNIMCSLIGKKMGAKHTIARIRTQEYLNTVSLLKDELGLSMIINPDMMAAERIARVISIPSALDVTSFFKGRIDMISIKLKKDSILNGKAINDMPKKIINKIIVFALERNGKLIIPKGSTKLRENDKIHLTGKRKDIASFLKYTSIITSKVKKVIISGGSNTAICLGKILLDMGISVKIIEASNERCKLLSEKLPKALIINGDVSNQNLLYEEGIRDCDAFVSLNSIDEENIVYSMFASMVNVPKVITKVNHIDLDGVTKLANIDTVITPHKIVSNQIVKYVRAMQNSGTSSCEAIYKFDNDNFEIVEFKVGTSFSGVGPKIKKLAIKDGILIIAILRGKSIIFPTGNDSILVGDTIIVIDRDADIKDLDSILE